MTMEKFYSMVGGSFEKTLSRLPSEAMIRKFVLKFPSDPTYAQLEAALPGGDETAFRAAHTLKGVAQNLGLDRLYESAAALTEDLRGPRAMTNPALWEKVQQDYAEVRAAIDKLEADA